MGEKEHHWTQEDAKEIHPEAKEVCTSTLITPGSLSQAGLTHSTSACTPGLLHGLVRFLKVTKDIKTASEMILRHSVRL